MAGQGSRTLKLSILADVDGLKKSLDVGSKDVDGFSGKIGEFSNKAKLAFAAAAAAAGAMAVKIGVDAVKAASDLAETISKVNVLFGTAAKDIEKFANGAAKGLGQTKQQALDAAATFATFGRSAGLTGQDLSKFSIDFIKLASDLASFNNTTPEQAINAIGSALRGESEPLRAYGVLLDDASLKAAALELGIINTTKNALTPQQKVLAAQALIYKQTSAAQGDFERTSDGLANKTRILSAELDNAKTTIGTALLPIVLSLATTFSDKIIPVVEKVAGVFSNKAGGLGESFNSITQSIITFVTPVFNGVVKLFNSVKDAVAANVDNFDAFLDVVKYVAPLVGGVVATALKVIAPIAGAVIEVFGTVIGAIKPVLNFVIDRINDVIRGLNIISPFKDIPLLSKIGSGPATSSSGNGTSVPTASLPSGFKPATATGQAGGLVGSEIITSPLAAVAASIPSASKTAASQTSDLNLASYPRAGNYAASGFPTGEMTGTTINVTVNGAIDKEGTARTIINTLNDSYYRGTGGSTALVS
jgi:hypothetical protein